VKYRHQYHAGNFADVHKHVLLLEVLAALARKDKGFLYVDTHAGRGEYQLHPGDAAHPAEWQAGAARLLAGSPRHPALLAYRDLLAQRQHGAALLYPGSPLIALSALRPADRAVFFETQRDEAGHLRRLVAQRERTRVEAADGFGGLRALLPPPERRGCVLIDPPYEEREDLARVRVAVQDALQRFESAVLILWLPLKLRDDFDGWFDKLRRVASRPLLASLLWMHPCDSRAALNGSAMVVVNPPYLLDQHMREWLPELRLLLDPGEGSRSGSELIEAGAGG
jgi:23S rRNA (adenine2030-N6)-methyltransferase